MLTNCEKCRLFYSFVNFPTKGVKLTRRHIRQYKKRKFLGTSLTKPSSSEFFYPLSNWQASKTKPKFVSSQVVKDEV